MLASLENSVQVCPFGGGVAKLFIFFGSDIVVAIDTAPSAIHNGEDLPGGVIVHRGDYARGHRRDLAGETSRFGAWHLIIDR